MANYKQIQLTQGKYALVDNSDYEDLSKYKWYAYKCGKNYYAARSVRIKGTKKKQTIIMHSLIAKTPDGMVTDHINGNGLDNRRENLRICSHRENICNCKPRSGFSRFKGVSWNVLLKKWRARICYKGKKISLGCYQKEEEAARAYDLKASEWFGEYAKLNFPHRMEVAS